MAANSSAISFFCFAVSASISFSWSLSFFRYVCVHLRLLRRLAQVLADAVLVRVQPLQVGHHLGQLPPARRPTSPFIFSASGSFSFSAGLASVRLMK